MLLKEQFKTLVTFADELNEKIDTTFVSVMVNMDPVSLAKQKDREPDGLFPKG